MYLNLPHCYDQIFIIKLTFYILFYVHFNLTTLDMLDLHRLSTACNQTGFNQMQTVIFINGNVEVSVYLSTTLTPRLI